MDNLFREFCRVCGRRFLLAYKNRTACSRECILSYTEIQNKRRAHRARKEGVQRNAHMLVAQAIKTGKLKKENCRNCGNEKTQGHHEDYNKPLDVLWLCVPCHSKEHVKINEAVSAI